MKKRYQAVLDVRVLNLVFVVYQRCPINAKNQILASYNLETYVKKSSCFRNNIFLFSNSAYF